MDKFDAMATKHLSFLDNEYVSSALTVFLILYAGMAAPQLPPRVAKIFDNLVVKLVVFFLVAYISRKNVTVAAVAAVGLMITLQTVDRHAVNRKMMKMVEKKPVATPSEEVPAPMPESVEEAVENGVNVPGANELVGAALSEIDVSSLEDQFDLPEIPSSVDLTGMVDDSRVQAVIDQVKGKAESSGFVDQVKSKVEGVAEQLASEADVESFASVGQYFRGSEADRYHRTQVSESDLSVYDRKSTDGKVNGWDGVGNNYARV